MRVPLGLSRHPGHAQQFICSLITDDTVWMPGHRWASYQHTARLAALKPGMGKNRQVDILQQWTMKMERHGGERKKRRPLCVVAVFRRKKHLDHNPWQRFTNTHIHAPFCMIYCQMYDQWNLKGPAALTSLNSWIWACSNMENTLELAPSADLFLAFLGAFWQRDRRWSWY